MSFWRSAEKGRAVAAAEATVEELIVRLNRDPGDARQVATELTRKRFDALSPRARRRLSEKMLRHHAETVLADDHLTIDEELAFLDLAKALGIDKEAFESTYHDLADQLVVARANDGRLAEVAEPKLLCERDEVVHLETTAQLMKEATVRQHRGGPMGVSFPIATGVRYRVRRTRGRLGAIGTQLKAADSGVLAISSQRAAYLGRLNAIEFPYAKLMGVKIFTDGIEFQPWNRVTTTTFRVESGDVVAATLNAAKQRFDHNLQDGQPSGSTA